MITNFYKRLYPLITDSLKCCRLGLPEIAKTLKVMTKNKTITVENFEIVLYSKHEEEFISLTDMADTGIRKGPITLSKTGLGREMQ